jgi:hypothetical protein
LRVSDWSKAGAEIRRSAFQCSTNSMLICNSYIYATPDTGTKLWKNRRSIHWKLPHGKGRCRS